MGFAVLSGRDLAARAALGEEQWFNCGITQIGFGTARVGASALHGCSSGASRLLWPCSRLSSSSAKSFERRRVVRPSGENDPEAGLARISDQGAGLYPRVFGHGIGTLGVRDRAWASVLHSIVFRHMPAPLTNAEQAELDDHLAAIDLTGLDHVRLVAQQLHPCPKATRSIFSWRLEVGDLAAQDDERGCPA